MSEPNLDKPKAWATVTEDYDTAPNHNNWVIVMGRYLVDFDGAVANQVREARLDEVNRIPNPAYIDSATGLRQEPNQQYKIDRLAQLKGEDK
jgi:hypothetical protein